MCIMKANIEIVISWFNILSLPLSLYERDAVGVCAHDQQTIKHNGFGNTRCTSLVDITIQLSWFFFQQWTYFWSIIELTEMNVYLAYFYLEIFDVRKSHNIITIFMVLYKPRSRIMLCYY